MNWKEITVGVKDEHYDAGWVVTQGSLIHKNDPPKQEADTIVTKLKTAGAIPVLQTTVPEFYLNFVTATRAWGVSRNPWNLKYAVGASSGGSGASLAAGYVNLATGSDMGGSIRIPSAFCGLYGIKPAFGYFHTDLPMAHFSGTGPMARTFGDMVLMYNVMAGPGPHSVNVAPSPKYPLTYKSIAGLKIAYLGGMGITEPSKDVASAMTDAIEVLKAQGATVDSVQFDFELTESLTEIFSRIALAGPMGGMFAGYADKTDQMTHYAKHFVEKSAQGGYGNKQLQAGEELTKEMCAKLADELYAKGYDVVIVPTLPTSHVPADYDFSADEALMEDDITFPKAVGMQYTLPFNILNWNPVISVPVGISSQGMPIGIQIVGKPHGTADDDTSYSFQIQPVYSIPTGKPFNLIARAVIPVVGAAAGAELPKLGDEPVKGNGTEWGLSDTILQLFWAPKSDSDFKWGVGPQVSLKTRTSDPVGGPDWGGGLSGVFFGLAGNISYGSIFSHHWGEENYNVSTIQPMIFYNIEALPGAYVSYSNSVTYSWKAGSGNRWQVPLGLTVGRTLPIGGKGDALDLSLGAYSLVAKPDGGADWQLKFGISWFLP